MGWFIIIGSLPIVVLGVAAQGRHRAATSAACGSIGTTLIVMGIVLGIADRIGGTDKHDQAASRLRDAVLMGARPGAAR